MTVLLTLDRLLPPHLTPAKASDSDYLHLSLNRGEIFVIFGPQGSGKSDLLACLAGLKTPRKGKVLYKGKAQSNPTGRERGMVPRIPGVYDELQVFEYLNFFAEVYQIDAYYRGPLISAALAICELEGKEQQKIGTLPFALRKRLSVARAVLPDPHLIFLEDPFYHLDRSEQQTMRAVLSRVQSRGTTLVATAPCLGEFSDMASHLCVLTSRKVLAYGPTSHLSAGLSCFKMMQVQFESGFSKAIRVLDEVPSVHHLSVSRSAANLVRFLFKGTDQELTDLLRKMAQEGATIVSYVEDQEFLGRGGRRLPR